MRSRRALAVFSFLFPAVLVASSFAQQHSGPLQARDSQNLVVGAVCGDGAGPLAMVCRQVNGLLFRLPLSESGFTPQMDAYFTSTDCSAPLFLSSSAGIYPEAIVIGDSAFVENTSAPAQTLTINSRRTEAGACELLPQPVAMNNLRPALEFSGYNVFSPPFTVRETSTATPLEAVDRDDVVVGKVCADGNGSPAVLCYQVDYLAFRLPLSRAGFINEDEIFFNGPNCTAPAAFAPKDGIYPSAVVAGSSAFVEDIATPLQAFTANSKRDASGACVVLPMATVMNNMAVARELSNFNTFAAPFRVREAGADLEAPLPPMTLSAQATSEYQVTLSWTAALDNIGVTGYLLERCTGVGCTNFAQIASLSGVSFNDTGLTPSTTYSYRLRAVDGATPPNASGYSNTATATTRDLPDAPQNLVITGTTTFLIKLAWSAPQNFAATEYRLERCKGVGCTNFTEIATTTALTYADDYRQANASYTYRVRARNAAGTFTGYSNTVAGIALQAPNETSTDVMFVMDSSGSVTSLGWATEKDFVADVITSQMPFNQGVGVVTFSDNALTKVPLTRLTDASAPGILSTVQAMPFMGGATATLDGIQNALTEFETRGFADSAKILFLITDGNPNPANTQNPCGSTASAVDVRARLTASEVTTVVIVVGPDIDANLLGCLYNFDSGLLYRVNDFSEDTFDTILQELRPYIDRRNSGIPTFPILDPLVYSSGQVTLTWSPSTDDDAVSAYVIERCQDPCWITGYTQIATVAGNVLTYVDTQPQPESINTYLVYAVDSEGNRSEYYHAQETSRQIALPDFTPPSAPLNLTATVSGYGAILADWAASTDNRGVAGYRVESCSGLGCSSFAEVATATATQKTLTGYADNTVLALRVRAVDAAGNLGGYSNTASVTVDAGPPTAPTGLTAVATGSSSIQLTWTTSTDISGIAQYRIERCSGSECTNFAQIGTTTGAEGFTDVNATASTDFRYRVRAKDGIGELSDYSNIASAVRSDTVPPTAPSSLMAALQVGSSLVDLTWIASTDGFAVVSYSVERCTGATCVDFAPVGASTGAAYTDTSTANDSVYRYRVRASDSAENTGEYSNIASVATVATATAPQNLQVTGTTTFRIRLAWSAPQNFAATEYRLERCKGIDCTNFTEIATTTTLIYADDYRQANASYTYRVRARNAAGSFSSYSNAVVGTAILPPNGTTIDVMLDMDSSGSVTSAGWLVEKNFAASFINTVIPRNNGVGVVTFSDNAATKIPLTLLTGTSAPGIVSTVQGMPFMNGNTATLDGIKKVLTEFETRGYPDSAKILLLITDGNPNPETQHPCGNTPAAADARARLNALNVTTVLLAVGPDINANNLGCLYDYAASRVFNVNGFSEASLSAMQVLLAPYFQIHDTGVPTVPNVNLPIYSSGQVTLTWNPAIDDDAVSSYVIERCKMPCATNLFAPIATVAGNVLTYIDTQLEPEATYFYLVNAFDAEGNRSDYVGAQGNSKGVTLPDITPPSVPPNVTATASALGEVLVDWGASTDNRGVGSYRVESCIGVGCSNFTQVASGVTATQKTLTGYADNTVLTFRVRAVDTSGNLGNYSNTATVTADAGPPTAPTGLTAAQEGSTSIRLNWIAATDISGITQYRIERCSGIACTNFAQIGTTTGATTFLDSSAPANTELRYRVRARDGISQLGSYSNIASPVWSNIAPPTTPTLSVSYWGFTTLRVEWTASSSVNVVTAYTIERCTGAGCTNFAVIATIDGSLTAYTDSVTANTTYRYRVRATDGELLSAYSNVIQFVVGGSTPQNLSIVFPTTSSYTLSWTASAAVQYSIEYCFNAGCTDFEEIATTTATTYHGNVLGTSTRRFRVRGVDALGDLSSPSNIVMGTFK